MYFASLREWQETPPSTQTSSRTLKKSSTAPNALPLFASVSQFCSPYSWEPRLNRQQKSGSARASTVTAAVKYWTNSPAHLPSPNSSQAPACASRKPIATTCPKPTASNSSLETKSTSASNAKSCAIITITGHGYHLHQSRANLRPTPSQNELCVEIHGQANPIHDAILEAICHELNATEICYPGIVLRLVYRPITPSFFPQSQDVGNWRYFLNNFTARTPPQGLRSMNPHGRRVVPTRLDAGCRFYLRWMGCQTRCRR